MPDLVWGALVLLAVLTTLSILLTNTQPLPKKADVQKEGTPKQIGKDSYYDNYWY